MRDYRGTIVRTHGGERAETGMSVVVTKQNFTHRIAWQALYATKHGLPDVAARLTTAHGAQVDVWWSVTPEIIGSDQDELWQCEEHGQVDCWHARAALEALPEVARRAIRTVHSYRAYEAQA